MTEVQPNGTQTNPQEDGFVVPPATDFETAALQGSMQRILSENLGKFVVCEFFVQENVRETKAGILHFVGTSYLVLYDDAAESYLVCDVNPLRFTTFTSPERQPAEEPPAEEDESLSPQAQNGQLNQLTPLPPPTGVQSVGANSQVKAAFNYTKRRARR